MSSSERRPHIEVDGGPDRDIYLNGERLSRYDGGMNHVQVETIIDNQTVVFTVGADSRLSASYTVWDFPNPEPLQERTSLERVEGADHPTYEGEWNGNELKLEILEREEE